MLTSPLYFQVKSSSVSAFLDSLDSLNRFYYHLLPSNLCNKEQNDKRPLNEKGHCTVQLARSVLLTYVDFTVVLPGKILFGICFSAANCCVTDLEDKAGDDHDQNGDISHLAGAKTRPSTSASTTSSPMPVRAQPPALQLKPAVREPGHGIPVPNHHQLQALLRRPFRQA